MLKVLWGTEMMRLLDVAWLHSKCDLYCFLYNKVLLKDKMKP